MRVALLLRGVNVGGVTVRSADLRSVLEDAGFGDVRTVLASGNAIVDVAPGDDNAAQRAEHALEARYGRRIRVAAMPLARLDEIVRDYPFALDDEHTPYVVLPLEPAALDALGDVDTPEQHAIVGDVLCWSIPKGTTIDSPFGKALTRLGRDATTTRNLRTLRKILAAG